MDSILYKKGSLLHNGTTLDLIPKEGVFRQLGKTKLSLNPSPSNAVGTTLSPLDRIERISASSAITWVDKKIFVTMMSGETISINVEYDCKIGFVKTKIKDRRGIPAHIQKVMYFNKELTYQPTIAEYKIPMGSTLHLA
ncbi:uncharacterized protein LOC143855761 [Tasmannia lanceolata]|uniref:uncharacterized protein LOC143855761 n=1 Tax=Tasmannia lanceolata TaxID=3420 RepID=UPI0040649168